jgi:hypothetical protein
LHGIVGCSEISRQLSEEFFMRVELRKTSVAVMTGAVFAAAFIVADLGAQKMTAADVAAKFTGHWVLNRELSPSLAPAGGGGARGAARPLYEVGFFGEFQGRRGGGMPGAGAQMSEADRAGQAAIRKIQQLAPDMEIQATVDKVTFVDARGTQSYDTNGKTSEIQLYGAPINVKSRWDKTTLKQQFIYGETNITQNWELDNTGDRINFKMQILNMSNQDPPREAKVVYDRKK